MIPRLKDLDQCDAGTLHEQSTEGEPNPQTISVDDDFESDNSPLDELDDIDHQLDWDAPGWSEAHRAEIRRRNSKVMTIALILSVAVHAMAVGTLYYVFHHSLSPPSFALVRSDGSAAGNTMDLDRLDPGRYQPQHGAQSQVEPQPSAWVPDLSADVSQDDVKSDIWNSSKPTMAAFQKSITNEAAGPTSSDAITPHPLVLPKLDAVKAPPIAATRPSLTVSAKSSGTVAKTQNSTARSIIADAAPPKIAGGDGSTGGNHKARNGYDNRGLPIPDYPAESRRRGEQGLVMLDVEVGIDGRAGQIKVVSSPGFQGLTNAAIEAVREAQFVPAEKGGQPIIGHLRIPFRFVLEQ